MSILSPISEPAFALTYEDYLDLPIEVAEIFV